MEAEVINIDDHRPHITIPTLDGNAHILPETLVMDWIHGDQKIVESDDWEIIIRTILNEWYQDLIKGT
jgi:hypothetical protein